MRGRRDDVEGDPVSITIVARGPGAIHLIASCSEGQIEVISGVRVEGSTLILDKLHVEGPGAGVLGPRRLRQLIREFGRIERVKSVRILGARRTTGARPGHLLRPIEVEVT